MVKSEEIPIRQYLEFAISKLENLLDMEHGFALNLALPLVGLSSLIVFFMLKGKRKPKRQKFWKRPT